MQTRAGHGPALTSEPSSLKEFPPHYRSRTRRTLAFPASLAARMWTRDLGSPIMYLLDADFALQAIERCGDSDIAMARMAVAVLSSEPELPGSTVTWTIY